MRNEKEVLGIHKKKGDYFRLKVGLLSLSCIVTFPVSTIASARTVATNPYRHILYKESIEKELIDQELEKTIKNAQIIGTTIKREISLFDTTQETNPSTNEEKLDNSEKTNQDPIINTDQTGQDNIDDQDKKDDQTGQDNMDNQDQKDDQTDKDDKENPDVKVPVYKVVNDSVYAKKDGFITVYKDNKADSKKLGKMIPYKKYVRISVGDDGYSRIKYENTVGYVKTKDLVKNKPSVPKNLVSLTDKKYSYADMKKDLQQLAIYYPDQVTVKSIGKTLDNRDIYVAVLGNPNAKKHILIQGSMHAREYINTQLLMGLLDKYARQYNTGSYKGVEYKKMFSDVAVHIIPMSNPDGVTLSQYGTKAINNKEVVFALQKMQKSSSFTRWKANANGVDLNKNFPYGFTKKTGVTKKGSMDYPGKKALSEKESKALATYTKNIKGLKTVLSYHCMGNIIYWDYGQTGTLRTQCKKLVALVREQTSYHLVTQSYRTIHYGGFSDWAVMSLGVPAVTIETGLLFAPVNHSQFNTIWKQNENMIPEVILKIVK